MVRHSSLLVIMLVAFVVWPRPTVAENIKRRHEKDVSGDVAAVSRTEVTVKVKVPREDTIRIPANDVQSISWTGEPAEANLARSDEAAGRYQRTIDGYQKSLQATKAANPLSKVDLEYGAARAVAKLALADPTKIDDAIRKLEEFRTKQGDHYRFYEAVGLLGRLYMSKKELLKAQSAFDTLAKAPWKEAQIAAKIASGRLLQVENKPDEAIAAFDAVIAQSATDRADESQRQEALLAKSQVLISQKKFDDAQKLLTEIVDRTDPDDAKVMAEAYVRLGDCLREQGKDTDALLAYLHVDVLFASEKSQQAEALFHMVRLFDKVGRKARSVEAREKLDSEEFKNTEWARQLKAPAVE